MVHITRQRTLILTRIESSAWGREDVEHRRSEGLRYWLLVPFWAYIFLVDFFIQALVELEAIFESPSRRK